MGEKKRNDNAFLVQGSILAIASIISRIIGMVYRLPLTAIIGKTGNDYYGTAFEIYNVILIISSYSIPMAVSKLVSARIAKGEMKNAVGVLKGALLFAGVSGGIASLIVWFGADYFTAILKTPMSNIALRVLSPVLLIVAIVGVVRGFFQGMKTMVPSAISQILEQIANAIISVVAAYLLFGYGARVGAVLGDEKRYAAAYGAAGGTLGTAAGACTSFAFMFFVLYIYRKRLRKKIRREKSQASEDFWPMMKILIMTIIPVLLSTTIYNISSIIDQGIFKNIVVLQGYSKDQISDWWGVYTGQYKVLINVPISIASAMAASTVPSLTASFRSGEKMRVRRQIHSATRFIMLIAFPCTVGLFVLAQPINRLLFHDNDPTTGHMMMAGAAAVVFYSLSTLSNGILQGIDRLRIPVKNAAVALIAQIGFLIVFLLVFHLNIYAVVLANAFYAALMCFLNGHAVVKYSGTHQNIRTTYLVPIIASIGMGIMVFLSYKIVEAVLFSNALATVISIFVGMFVYFMILLLMRGVTEQELRRIPKGTVLIRFAKKLRLL